MGREAASYYNVFSIWTDLTLFKYISYYLIPFSQQNCRMTIMPIYSWGNCLKLIQRQVLLFPRPVLFGRPLGIHTTEPWGGSSGPKSSATDFKQNFKKSCQFSSTPQYTHVGFHTKITCLGTSNKQYSRATCVPCSSLLHCGRHWALGCCSESGHLSPRCLWRPDTKKGPRPTVRQAHCRGPSQPTAFQPAPTNTLSVAVTFSPENSV